MFWILLSLPLLSSIISGFFGRFLSRSGVVFLTNFFMFLSVIVALSLFYTVGLHSNTISFKSGVWLNSEDLIVYWGFLIDNLTSVMLLVVTTISLCVHSFSSEYMKEDPHLQRFLSLLSIFTFFMLILITSDNLFQLFFGWEGVGVCSYLLINFWYTRVQANKSSIKALVINKIGDLSLLLGILLIFSYLKTIDIKGTLSILTLLSGTNIILFGKVFTILSVCSFFVIMGAVGKSAQIGLHTWLPDAMEGPTPVSALIHAATMVTAGVFLLIRVSTLLEHSSPLILTFITSMGIITCFFFSWVGVYQYDLKKIIAYSTCSQLGYMFFTCGSSNYMSSLFHISTHACFKALLFLTAGSIIHALNNEQDIRKMGGLIKFYPFYGLVFLIGSLSLAGFPFLSGFFSKDLILELAGTLYILKGTLSVVFGELAAYFSFFYSLRLIDLVFWGDYRGHKSLLRFLHYPSVNYYIILTFLSILSVILGFISFDIFAGTSTNFFKVSFFQTKNIIFENEMVPFLIKELPLILSIVGFLIYHLLTNSLKLYLQFYLFFYPFNKILKMRIGFDFIYNIYFGNFFLNLSYFFSFKLLDKFFFEAVGPRGVPSLIFKVAHSLSPLQSGFIYHYIGMFMSLFLLMVDILL